MDKGMRIVSRRKALERALQHVIDKAPCDCPRRHPNICVHTWECWLGQAIDIASDYNCDDADEELLRAVLWRVRKLPAEWRDTYTAARGWSRETVGMCIGTLEAALQLLPESAMDDDDDDAMVDLALVRDKAAWHAFIASQEQAIREMATDDEMAELLLRRLRGREKSIAECGCPVYGSRPKIVHHGSACALIPRGRE